jgi:sugar/nucleoside kinase (ribokinase family)
MTKKRLLAYGDIAMDVIVRTASTVGTEQDEKVDNLFISPGGSAVNCAVVASSLGVPATFLGVRGSDHWSNLLEKDMRKHKVDSRHLLHVPGQMAICISILDPVGERKFYSYRGVNAGTQFPALPASIIRRHACLHLSGYSFQTPQSSAVAISLLGAAKENNLLISLDPSFLFARDLDRKSNDILTHIDYFFPSREEAYQLTKLRDPLKAARKIREQGPEVVVVTLDSDGCLLVDGKTEKFIKLSSIDPVVDTTGAGDAFCGGFLFAVLNGIAPVDACLVGSAAAAHTIARYGAHESPPTRGDIIQILRRNDEKQLAARLESFGSRGIFGRMK